MSLHEYVDHVPGYATTVGQVRTDYLNGSKECRFFLEGRQYLKLYVNKKGH